MNDGKGVGGLYMTGSHGLRLILSINDTKVLTILSNERARISGHNIWEDDYTFQT